MNDISFILFHAAVLLFGVVCLTRVMKLVKILSFIMFAVGLAIIVQEYSARHLQALIQQEQGTAVSSPVAAGAPPGPSAGGPLFEKGVSAEKSGQYDQAIQLFSQVIEQHPDFFGGYHHRGGCYAMKREFEKALQDYQRAIDLKPEEATLYYNRGLTFSLMGKSPEALADYSRAVELNPAYLNAYLTRGTLYAETGRLDEALEDRTKVIQLDPQNAQWYGARAAVYIFQKAFDPALADINKAVELAPEDASLRFFRGMIYAEMGQKDKASAEFKAAETMDAQYTGIGEKMAAYIARQKEAQGGSAPAGKAEADGGLVPMEQENLEVLKKEPGNLDALLYLAAAYVGIGKGDLAVEYAEKALAANPEAAANRDAILVAAMGYYYSGNLKKSYAMVGRALERTPDDRAALDLKQTLEYARDNYYGGDMPEDATFEGFRTLYDVIQAVANLGVGIPGRDGEPDEIRYQSVRMTIHPPLNWQRARNARMPNGTYVIFLYAQDTAGLLPSIAVTRDNLPDGITTALDFSRYVNKIMEKEVGGEMDIPEPKAVDINGLKASYIEMGDKARTRKTAWYQFLISGAIFSFQYTNSVEKFEEGRRVFEDLVRSLVLEEGQEPAFSVGK
ncbi:MAG TPA: tetratricopeptide repeat protein [Candidatus Omnitrophota bacterium]|nr:tetratricopeptide repeat protein [Candidatus Omnitrophota bacterium]